MIKILTESPNQTRKIGEVLAKEVLENPLGGRAFVLGLRGDLGGGKTVFLQGFAKGLGIKERITSPTFVLMRRFPVLASRYKNFYHLDCYRIEGSKDILSLGFKDILSDPQNIVAVEWADKISKLLKRFVLIRFKFIGEKRRELTIDEKR